MRSVSLTLIALILCVAAAPALAQFRGPYSNWSATVYGEVAQSPYIGGKNAVVGLPSLKYTGNGYSIALDEVSVRVFRGRFMGRNLATSARLKLRRSPLVDTGIDELSGIDRRHNLDLGLNYRYALSRRFSIGGHILQDVAGRHEGQELENYGTALMRAGPVILGLKAGATWYSESLAEYTYGVLDTDTTDLGTYDPGNATVPFVSVGTQFRAGQKGAIFVQVKYESLPKAITNSPIVEEKEIFSLGTGFAYRF